MTINDRIALILQDKHLTANEFAARLKVQSSNISHIITGRNKPSFSFLEKVAMEFPEVSTDWLIRGNGSMYVSADSEVLETIVENNKEAGVSADIPYQNSLFDLFDEKTGNKIDDNPTDEIINIRQCTDRDEIKTSKAENKCIPKSKINKIIVYYDNGSFEEFVPNYTNV